MSQKGAKLIDYHKIGNKQKRQEVYKKQKLEKNKTKKKDREKRKRETEALGAEAVEKKQKTIENTREPDETIVLPEDEEVKGEEEIDEFSAIFKNEKKPKLCITTCYKASKRMYNFIRDLLWMIPNSFYYERRGVQIKKIVEAAPSKGFTALMILNEDRKAFNGLTLIHLPNGPTAHFRLSSVTLCSEIPGHAKASTAKPEVILNNFNTRLGHRIGRMWGALFDQEPNFKARRVATFHNQRDFVFMRNHRYIFDGPEKARIQETGPRFTLKLRWLQHGTFDTKHGQYEWIHKKEMDTSRRRFFL